MSAANDASANEVLKIYGAATKTSLKEHQDAFDLTGQQWTGKLRVSDSGSPKAVIANAVTAFREAPEWRDMA